MPQLKGICKCCRYNSSDYLEWSLSSFKVDSLIDGRAFPAFTAHKLLIYDLNGQKILDELGDELLYLPYIDFECVSEQFPELHQYFRHVAIGEK